MDIVELTTELVTAHFQLAKVEALDKVVTDNESKQKNQNAKRWRFMLPFYINALFGRRYF